MKTKYFFRGKPLIIVENNDECIKRFRCNSSKSILFVNEDPIARWYINEDNANPDIGKRVNPTPTTRGEKG